MNTDTHHFSESKSLYPCFPSAGVQHQRRHKTTYIRVKKLAILWCSCVFNGSNMSFYAPPELHRYENYLLFWKSALPILFSQPWTLTILFFRTIACRFIPLLAVLTFLCVQIPPKRICTSRLLLVPSQRSTLAPRLLLYLLSYILVTVNSLLFISCNTNVLSSNVNIIALLFSTDTGASFLFFVFPFSLQGIGTV